MLLRNTGKQSASISFNPFQCFGLIPWKPVAQWYHAGCCSEVGAQQRKLLHCSSFSYVERWANSGKQALQAGVCVLFFSSGGGGWGWGGENEEKKNTERVFLCLLSKLQWQHGSRLLMPLTLQRSRSVRNWSFFLCLNLWLMYQRNTEATGLARQNTLWVSRRWELCFLRIRVCKTHEKLGSACLSKLPSIFPALLPN